MRKAIILALVLAVIGAAGWFGYQRLQKAQAAARPTWEEVVTRRGDLESSVSATGAILPLQSASLSFQSAGTIADVGIEVGDTVRAGQQLASLDTADLELALRQAEIGVRTAKSQLAQLREEPNAVDVAAAQAGLQSAEAAYREVLKGADADRLAGAQAQVEEARVRVEQAQRAYDQVKDRPDVGLLPQSLQLQQATIAYETAQANYRVATRKADQAQLAQAQAQIAQAQANLDRLTRGPSAEQVAVAQASVDQAQVAVDQAQRRLDTARIVAPWAGTVTAVNIVEGALAQPGAPAVSLSDISKYHLDVEVDEVDIAAVAEGQPVTIQVDALPDTVLTGMVERIPPSSQINPTGGVTYLVRIAIDPTDVGLRSGMSATADIVSNSRTGVIVIPNRAVQLERDTGRTFVERLQPSPDGTGTEQPQRVEVRLGLRNELESEVREGLAEGDRLAIRTRSGLEQLQQTFGGGGGF
jgi:HlyD family secretion protein